MRQNFSAHEREEIIIIKDLLKVGSDINTKKNIFITVSNKVQFF